MLPKITTRLRAFIAFVVAVLAIFFQMSNLVTQDQARAVVAACILILILLIAPPIIRHYFPRVSFHVTPPPAWVAFRDRRPRVKTSAPVAATRPEQAIPPKGTTESRPIPADWTAPIWQGKQVLPCPFCKYRTVSDPDFQAHMETHTEPPTAALRQEVYSSQRPWAKVPIRCLAQNNMYHQSGVPLDATRTLYTSESRATELEQTGLYERGEVEGHHEVAETHGTEVTCTCGWRGDGALYPFHPNL